MQSAVLALVEHTGVRTHLTELRHGSIFTS